MHKPPSLTAPLGNRPASTWPVKVSLSALIVVVLAGCSTLGSDDAPGCTGPRRPANPHGSVLAPAAREAPLPAVAGPTGGCGKPRS
jgi:hypothetical protein